MRKLVSKGYAGLSIFAGGLVVGLGYERQKLKDKNKEQAEELREVKRQVKTLERRLWWENQENNYHQSKLETANKQVNELLTRR